MSKMKLDMTNVESFTRMEEGIHKVKIVSCEEKTSQAGDPMLMLAFESISGTDKGSRVFDNFVLTDKALWKLKQLLLAIGIKCDGKIVLDTDKLIGKICEASIFHDEYNGQTRARVDEYTKLKAASDDDDFDEDEEDDEPEEKPVKKQEKKPAKSKKKPDPEPEEDDEEDDWEDEEEEEPAPKKSNKKPESKKKPAKKPEPEEDDDEDWEEA